MKKNCIIIILCTLLSMVSVQSFAILPDRTYRFYPEKLGLIYKDLKVVTPDSLKIKTWFFPAQPALSDNEVNAAWENPVKKPYQTIDSKRRSTLIIANGDAGNMSWNQMGHVPYFTGKGYNVVTFDWRDFGESSEWKMNTDYLSYTEMLIDYDSVIKEVLQQQEVDTSAIAVFGWSTGAYFSMAAASKYNNIKAFIAIGLITTFHDAYPYMINAKKDPEIQKKKGYSNKIILPANYPSELLPLNLAPTWNKATFLIVGELDDRTPVWMSEKIYELLPSKKELWIVEGAEHGGAKGPSRDFDLLNKKIDEFLKLYLE